MNKQSATVQAIEEERQFMARLADAYRIKCNPRITNKESLYYALYGYLPYDMPESAQGIMA